MFANSERMSFAKMHGYHMLTMNEYHKLTIHGYHVLKDKKNTQTLINAV